MVNTVHDKDITPGSSKPFLGMLARIQPNAIGDSSKGSKPFSNSHIKQKQTNADYDYMISSVSAEKPESAHTEDKATKCLKTCEFFLLFPLIDVMGEISSTIMLQHFHFNCITTVSLVYLWSALQRK